MKIGVRLLILFAIFIGCKMPEQTGPILLQKHELESFASASAIEFYGDKLYVVGDDSRSLLVLDKDYNFIESVELFPGDTLRIPKKEKSDLEASTIVQYKDKPCLMVAGSSSKTTREVFFLFPLNDMLNYERLSATPFIDSLREQGLTRINLEGLAMVNDMLVFANRANMGHPHNHLIAAPSAFITQPDVLLPKLIKLKLGKDEDTVKGVSGLAYIKSLDLLLFTASIEMTANEVDDAGIGDSFLGYISGFSNRLTEEKLKPDALFNLSEYDERFNGEKIESVAVESFGENIIVHLVADNDDGTSTLFKVQFSNPVE
jgi:hypothetical protein